MSVTAVKRTVLIFLFNNDGSELLMIHKKRGQGAGKWNVPGGKLLPGENEEAAATRECEEECGLKPLQLELAGKLEFYFPAGNAWDNLCTVFRAHGFTGVLVKENEECTAEWISCDKIPYEKMWDSDRLWTPLLFQGNYFHRSYTFDEKDKVTEEKVLI